MTPDFENKISYLDEKKDKNRIRIKNSEDRDAFQRVFDVRTLNIIIKFLRNQKLEELIGIISQGKEANIYFAYGQNEEPLAIKVYKINKETTKWMKNYIIGDPRFKKLGNSGDKLIFTWCQKEYKNLKDMTLHQIPCPEPIYSKFNILIMKFIGDDNGSPAPKLKDSVDQFKDPEFEFDVTLNIIKDLYQKVHIVHGDLSEFNILYYKNKQYVIDVSQGVNIKHPQALYFLNRDIKNILTFYEKIGVKVPDPKDVYYNIIQEEKNHDE